MIRLLISDKSGRIYKHSHLEGVGMKAGHFFRLKPTDLIKLPPASSVFMLPHRIPVGFEPLTKSMIVLDGHNACAAFLPPGYTVTYNAAFKEDPSSKILPLFSYAAVVSYKGSPHAAAIRIDPDRRHDSMLIDISAVRKNVKRFKKIFGRNRLIPHLERCALVYGCPNAQNFFLNRHEAPLPTSPACNASCAGCISYQSGKTICATQPRIKFVPTAEEISNIALFHIDNVKDPIVSFGQGCEGEPLLAGDVIERSIRLIRDKTSKGTININTNGSLPETVSRLFDAGLDSIRISLNSARKIYYTRYYNPKNYCFEDVLRSIKISKEKGGFVSLNYLTMPGFTDSKDEFLEFKKLIRLYCIDMVQWRNLNYDPMLYFRKLKLMPGKEELAGIKEIIKSLRKDFPRLRMGYFNPALLIN